jgi:cytochrome P450
MQDRGNPPPPFVPHGCPAALNPLGWHLAMAAYSQALQKRHGDVVRFRCRGRIWCQITDPGIARGLLETEGIATQLLPVSGTSPELRLAARLWRRNNGSEALPDFSRARLATFRERLGREIRTRLQDSGTRILNIRAVVTDACLAAMAELLLGPRHQPDLRELGRHLRSLNCLDRCPSRRWPWSCVGAAWKNCFRHRRALDALRRIVAVGLAQGGEACGPYERRAIDRGLALFLAGQSTVVAALTESVRLLVHHPAVQDWLVLGSTDSAAGPGYETPQENFIDPASAVIAEVIRLFPPVPLLAFKTRAEREVAGMGLARGTRCLIPVGQILRDARWFARPDEFRPARFLAAGPDRSAMLLPYGLAPWSTLLERLVLEGAGPAAGDLVRNFRLAELDEGVKSASTGLEGNCHGVPLFIHLRRRRLPAAGDSAQASNSP